MLVNQTVQLALLAAAAILWESDAATTSFKICGRQLTEIMSRVCHVYNSPNWDVPTVVEQPGALARKRRQAGGIAECCSYGCTLEQLNEYCSVSANTESLLTELDTHLIEDRSAEQESIVATSGSGSADVPATVGRASRVPAVGEGRQEGSIEERRQEESRREVGAPGASGYGRARGRRCRCRRKRRSGRRRASSMGNMEVVRSAPRAAPVVGTVSPLLTWGRTLYTDLPHIDRDRYAYVAVYST